MKSNVLGVDRLNNIIAETKKDMPVKIEKLLKSEIVNVIKNYFVVANEDVSLSILIDKDRLYNVQINFSAKDITIANVFA